MSSDIATIALACGLLEAFIFILTFTLYNYGGKPKPLKYIAIGQLCGSSAAVIFYLNKDIYTLIATSLAMVCIILLINSIEAIQKRPISYYLYIFPVISFIQGIMLTMVAPFLLIRVTINSFFDAGLCIIGAKRLYALAKDSKDGVYLIMCLAFVATAVMTLVRLVALTLQPQFNPFAHFNINIVWSLTIAVSVIGVGFGLVIIHMRQLPNELEKVIEGKNQDLKAAYGQMTEIFNSLGEQVLVLDNTGRYVLVNKASEVFTGKKKEDKIGRLFWEVYPGVETTLFGKKILEVLVTKKPQFFEFRSEYFGCWTEVHICPFSDGCVVVYKDIEKKKLSEHEAKRLDRMNLVGQMAAGIGHEIRNPMTTVRGYLQLLRKKEQFKLYQDQMATMIEELDRANCIITEYLSLAKNKAVDMKQGNLNDVVLALLPLMQSDAWRMGHTLETELGEIPFVFYDTNDMRQLLLNLARNALEAMEPEGEVTIRTYTQNDVVVLEIRDTGPGMPATVMQNLGTPFTTTKENGTGLGLSICYGIAERHKAKINIDSDQNGTTFYIEFPITADLDTQ